MRAVARVASRSSAASISWVWWCRAIVAGSAEASGGAVHGDFDALFPIIQDGYRAIAGAALACLKPGSRFTVDGVECVVVRKDALDWLNGEGDSFERPDAVRGNFWWRGEFRRRAMLRACEEK